MSQSWYLIVKNTYTPLNSCPTEVVQVHLAVLSQRQNTQTLVRRTLKSIANNMKMNNQLQNLINKTNELEEALQDTFLASPELMEVPELEKAYEFFLQFKFHIVIGKTKALIGDEKDSL